MSGTDKETSDNTRTSPDCLNRLSLPFSHYRKYSTNYFLLISLLTIAAPTLCLTNDQWISHSSSSQCPEIYFGSVFLCAMLSSRFGAKSFLCWFSIALTKTSFKVQSLSPTGLIFLTFSNILSYVFGLFCWNQLSV